MRQTWLAAPRLQHIERCVRLGRELLGVRRSATYRDVNDRVTTGRGTVDGDANLGTNPSRRRTACSVGRPLVRAMEDVCAGRICGQPDPVSVPVKACWAVDP
jgi:hypothetical protein